MHARERRFVQNGASVHSFDKKSKSRFYFACKTGNFEALDHLLKNSTILPRCANDLRGPPVHLAARFGRLPLVQKLWDCKWMDGIRDIHGNAPLRLGIVKSKSADPNLMLEKNRDCDTPLPLAVAAMNKPLVEYFCAFGLKFKQSES